MDRAYLDHAATTPLDPRVLEAMIPALERGWGNPSGIYREAQYAAGLLDQARDDIAGVLECSPSEVVLTSGGTESDNLAIRGAALAQDALGRGRHLITQATEHHAVLHTMEQLEREGFELSVLDVDSDGFVDPEQAAGAVRDDTAVVSIMLANNEIGTVQPIAEIARAVKERNRRTVVHTDAVQAAGAVDIRPDPLGVDLMSLTAHKIYGPKGAGLLYARRRSPLQPLQLGGGQEEERRAGTESVAQAVGLAKALALAEQERVQRTAHASDLRNRLWRELNERVHPIRLNGPSDWSRRLANNLNVSFPGVEGESILLQLDLEGFAASSGSACSTGSTEPSHVLTAIGLDPDTAHSTVRLSLGQSNTDAHIEGIARSIEQITARLRALSPV
ncbi:MAG: cysteine desulfurase [Chloroflexi bacterium]|nr:cysteine desulfurase [Chloroflexota bacterium]MYD17257.1 cysteine desulfurase [Chloroflexota bacterium]